MSARLRYQRRMRGAIIGNNRHIVYLGNWLGKYYAPNIQRIKKIVGWENKYYG